MADRARLVELLGSRKWGLYRSGQKEYTTSFRSLLPKGRKDFKEVGGARFDWFKSLGLPSSQSA